MKNKTLLIIAGILTIILLFVFFNKKSSTVTKSVTVVSPTTDFSSYDGNSEQYILFYADWCPHCIPLKPIFNDYIRTQPVRGVKFHMIEESNRDHPYHSKYKQHAKSYPTLVRINKHGKYIDSTVGKPDIVKKIKKIM